MLISGFTFIKNGILLDYPFLESIKSMLPIVDELVVVCGDSTDNTKQAILDLNEPKIRIIDSIWDADNRVGGFELAVQTNIALDHIKGFWGLYLQGDEVLHEDYLNTVRSACEEYLNDSEVEGLLFKYKHFYGSYQYIGIERGWYRQEVRVVRNLPTVRSFKDAQGFRIADRKLSVKSIEAEIYHYGWVRTPEALQKKLELVNPLWHDDQWMQKNVHEQQSFNYDHSKLLAAFKGTHPAEMKERIARLFWTFPYDPAKVKVSFIERLSLLFERLTGIRIGEYKNFRQI